MQNYYIERHCLPAGPRNVKISCLLKVLLEHTEQRGNHFDLSVDNYIKFSLGCNILVSPIEFSNGLDTLLPLIFTITCVNI